jgi:hypothetical protein
VTTSGADIPEYKECGRLIIPAFPYIRTSSLFTNSMQMMSIHQVTDFLVMGAWTETDFKPGREVFPAGGPYGGRGRNDL